MGYVMKLILLAFYKTLHTYTRLHENCDILIKKKTFKKMPPPETKFVLARIVVSAVFISLCVPSEAETRRCYWCGPLAEQVHRSQRAPPCSAPDTQVTDCDPGFPYCAIVATAPPNIESRYCVKLYQDECYLLYCNSTRTWRMTCPCRGDLCNGPNTERELDAFAGLAKLAAKTQHSRNRRALMNTAGFISLNTNRKNRIDNTTAEENKNIVSNLTENPDEADVKANDDEINDTTVAAETDAKDTESHIDTTAASVSQDDKSDETEKVETTTQENVEVKNNEVTTNIPITEEVIKTIDSHMNETSIQIDIPSATIESSDLKTEIIVMSSEIPKVLNDTKLPDITSNVNIPDVPTTAEIATQSAVENKVMAETTTKATNSAPEMKMNENNVKPSESLPTMKALQQDTTVAKTTATLRATTTDKPRNNTATRIDAHLFTLAVGVVLNYV
ncbi:hypothetical protein PYW07_008968 [Mythimna separata]|uniref:Uncharacterized protein n=1 Tax=Mythimna separata TaxID=271217 RepID=A0AAD7YAS7_MYTSE|nr:hypothetical protein PYW07_008968 [Mythimna separata]